MTKKQEREREREKEREREREVVYSKLKYRNKYLLSLQSTPFQPDWQPESQTPLILLQPSHVLMQL